MKQLLVLRHAKSSWDDAGLDDHDRPLNKRGCRDAPRMGRLLQRESIRPDRILSSTATRARTTAQEVARACAYDGEVSTTEQLYLADPEAYIALLAQLDAGCETVMVVGHNPGVEELVRRLCGESVAMPTAALAQIRLPIDSWSDVGNGERGDLVGFWRPKQLPESL